MVYFSRNTVESTVRMPGKKRQGEYTTIWHTSHNHVNLTKSYYFPLLLWLIHYADVREIKNLIVSIITIYGLNKDCDGFIISRKKNPWLIKPSEARKNENSRTSDCSSLLYSLPEYYHIHYTYPQSCLKSLWNLLTFFFLSKLFFFFLSISAKTYMEIWNCTQYILQCSCCQKWKATSPYAEGNIFLYQRELPNCTNSTYFAH